MGKRLSPAMLELLTAIQSGARVLYMPTNGRYDPYYYRVDTNKAVSNTVYALMDRGLIEFESLMHSHARLTDAGCAALTTQHPEGGDQ